MQLTYVKAFSPYAAQVSENQMNKDRLPEATSSVGKKEEMQAKEGFSQAILGMYSFLCPEHFFLLTGFL